MDCNRRLNYVTKSFWLCSVAGFDWHFYYLVCYFNEDEFLMTTSFVNTCFETFHYKLNKDTGRWELKPKRYFKVTWEDIEGKEHIDWFVRPPSYSLDGMSWIHAWANPEEGVRRFLTHVSLHNIKIEVLVEN